MGGSKNPSVSPSPLRKEQADSSDPQNWQQPGGSNSSGSLLGGDGDLVDGGQADGGDASVINIGEPGTGQHLNNEIHKIPKNTRSASVSQHQLRESNGSRERSRLEEE